MKSYATVYKAFIKNCHEKNLYRTPVTTEPASKGKIYRGHKAYINFSSNDYLGLNHHPAVKQAAEQAVSKYGAGLGASRLVTGNCSQFQEIEQKIAALKGKEAALVMASGFQTNAAVLQALLDKSVLKATPSVVSDRLNHASMHFGCAAAGVRQTRYHHLDAAHAKEHLWRARKDSQDSPRFCLTETVFSMDGDIAPMQELGEICQETDTMLIADDAHGFGLLGEGGKGLGGEADVIIGTFSKALGSFGAYVAASAPLIDYLIQKCSGLIYSTALPPAILGAINAALDVLPSLDAEREQALSHAENFRAAMHELGYSTGRSATQIVPVIIGGEEEALALSEHVREQGLWVTAIRPPTVPKGSARLRCSFTASHSKQDVTKLINAIAAYRKETYSKEKEKDPSS